jgi:hypothetical protein
MSDSPLPAPIMLAYERPPFHRGRKRLKREASIPRTLPVRGRRKREECGLARTPSLNGRIGALDLNLSTS